MTSGLLAVMSTGERITAHLPFDHAFAHPDALTALVLPQSDPGLMRSGQRASIRS